MNPSPTLRAGAPAPLWGFLHARFCAFSLTLGQTHARDLHYISLCFYRCVVGRRSRTICCLQPKAYAGRRHNSDRKWTSAGRVLSGIPRKGGCGQDPSACGQPQGPEEVTQHAQTGSCDTGRGKWSCIPRAFMCLANVIVGGFHKFKPSKCSHLSNCYGVMEEGPILSYSNCPAESACFLSRSPPNPEKTRPAVRNHSYRTPIASVSSLNTRLSAPNPFCKGSCSKNVPS